MIVSLAPSQTLVAELRLDLILIVYAVMNYSALVRPGVLGQLEHAVRREFFKDISISRRNSKRRYRAE